MDASAVQTICAIISAGGVLVSVPSAIVSIKQYHKTQKLMQILKQ